MLKKLIKFPIVTAIVGSIIIIYGTFKENDTSIQVGGSVVGIAGTAYQTYKKSEHIE